MLKHLQGGMNAARRIDRRNIGVGDKQLRQRDMRVEQDSICTNRTNNQPATPINPDSEQIDFRIDRVTEEVFEIRKKKEVNIFWSAFLILLS